MPSGPLRVRVGAHLRQVIPAYRVGGSVALMTGEHVSVDNFVRAEMARMFAAIQGDAGSVNRFMHNRVPTPLDHQPVIRMNRDTLYSAAVVDISAGAQLTIPDAGARYVSVMVITRTTTSTASFTSPACTS